MSSGESAKKGTKRRSRRRRAHWWVSAFFGIMALVFAFTAGVIRVFAEGFLKQHAGYVWVAFIVSLIACITAAVREARRSRKDEPGRDDASAQGAIQASKIDVVAVGPGAKAAGTIIEQQTNIYPALKEASEPGGLPVIASTPGFVGRKKELADLTEAIKKGGAVIAGLRGTGGIGKTALARQLIHTLAGDYPDGQVEVNLFGSRKNPLAPPEAMKEVIWSVLSRDLKLPDDPVSLKKLYLQSLNGKRLILLFDDARDADQVSPLIQVPPGSGVVVIVTSRQSFDLGSWFRLDLDCLPAKDACKLLLALAPRIGEHAGELAELCGCLPLALRLAGGALAARASMKIEEYTAELKDAKSRLATLDKFRNLTAEELGIEASLELSYTLLGKHERGDLRGFWRTAGVFPGEFEEQAAAAVWQLPPAVARERLEDLRGYSMIEWTESSDRWRLHDLARDFALGRLGESAKACGTGVSPVKDTGRRPMPHKAVKDTGQRPVLQQAEAREEESAQLRHAEHYCGVLAEAKRLYKAGGEDVRRGLSLFDLERRNVEAAQAWAAERAERDKAAAKLASDYPDAGVYVLSLRQHPRERIGWLDAALAAARRLGDKAAEGGHLGNLGNAYADLGEVRKAVEYYEQDLAIAREIGDRRGEGAGLGNLGNAYADLGEVRKAVEYYEQDLAIAREIGDRRGEGAALGNLGLAYADLGEVRKAIEYYEQALAVLRELGDKRAEGSVLGNLGLAYADLGEVRKAVGYYEQDLAIAREIGDRRGEGAALGNLGNAYADLGEVRKAIEYYEQRLAIAREIGDRRGEGNALGNLGLAYAALGEVRKAIEYYEQYLAIAREIGDRDGEGKASWNLGLAYEKLGDPARAVELMQVCVDYERELGHPDAEKDAARVAELRRKMRKGKNKR